MFNWFDKLLVKIAKKILNKYAPTGEFIAYINEQEEKVLKDLGGYGQPVNETGVKSFYSLTEAWEDAKDFYTNNKDIIHKVGTGLGKAWIDMNDQERKNAVTEKAYNDYMSQVEAAGKEAQSAIDLNLTPMTISNVPTTKADITDFTAVAARGGLMNLPTRQRKRYASQGFVEDDIEIMEPESLGDFELQKEEGVNIGEQVFQDTGDPMTNARNVWDSGAIDQEIYQLDFEIFFKSGDWMDHISRGTVQGDTQMAKGNFNNPPYQPTQGAQDAAIQEIMAAQGGIIGLRHGGRPGYQFGIGPQQGLMSPGLMPQQGLRPGYAEQGFVNPQTSAEPFRAEEEIIENQTGEIDGTEVINTGDGIKIYIDEKEDQPRIVGSGFQGEEKILIIETDMGGQVMISEKDYFEKYGIPKYKKGGRVKRDNGGIMDLGGLEKDYRTTGGFVPIGGQERADDVPARLSKNEFVMTADAVRAAGGGSINKGAQRMYNTMKHLEASPQSNRMIS